METILSEVIDFLLRYEYFAMFGILFLCGLGLPIPEEVTLLGSGLLVGWDKAEFTPATIACVLGILAGDSMIFGMGYLFGDRFLASRPMQLVLSSRRQEKVGAFFQKHGNKAVFLARFVAGVRIGVYAYAGSQRMSWLRFLALDLIGAIFSGGLSILIGAWAATKFADDIEEAEKKALELAEKAGHWVLIGVATLLVVWLAFVLFRRRRRIEAARQPLADEPDPAELESDPALRISQTVDAGAEAGGSEESR